VVEYEDGVLRVQCSAAAVSTVFEEIAFVTGMKPIVDKDVSDIPLTADIESASMKDAIEQLLAGTRLNYAMRLSARDPLIVESVYVAAATATRSGPRRSVRPSTRRVAASPATTRKNPKRPQPASTQEVERPRTSGEALDARRWESTGQNADGSAELGQDYERAVEADDYYADDPYYEEDDDYGEQVASDFDEETDWVEEPEYYGEEGAEYSSLFDDSDGFYTPHLDAFGRPMPARRKRP
jgi:hypothetical protein